MRTLVDAHATNLSRYVTSILHDQDAAKDVVQDAFMRLWKEPRKNVKGHERPWLFRVCSNRALDYQRKGSRLQAMNSATEQTLVDTPNPQTQAEEQDRVQSGDLVSFESTSDDFRFTAAVAAFGLRLTKSEHLRNYSYKQIESLAVGAIGEDSGGHRSEFIDLVLMADSIQEKIRDILLR